MGIATCGLQASVGKVRLGKVRRQVEVDEMEEMAVVLQAVVGDGMDYMQGHLYRCPNGHVYVIGNCRAAVEGGKCLECGEPVRGVGQHGPLQAGNRRAEDLVRDPYWAPVGEPPRVGRNKHGRQWAACKSVCADLLRVQAGCKLDGWCDLRDQN